MFIKKFDILDKLGITKGYGLLNTENGVFGILSKERAVQYAKEGKLTPYIADNNTLQPALHSVKVFDKLSGKQRIMQLSLNRCSQYQGYVNIEYLKNNHIVIIGDYVYMESRHNRLYMVGTLYVPEALIPKYHEFTKMLARRKCLIRNTGIYTLTDKSAIVSIDNVFDLINLLKLFEHDNFIMDLSHLPKFDYDVAGETEMYNKICKNAKDGKYFSELDAPHRFFGLVNYVRGASEKRLSK